MSEVVQYNFAQKIIRNWVREEATLFENVGYDDWSIIPFPENPRPAPQFKAISHPTPDGKTVKYSFQDVVDTVNRSRLLRNVPSNIFSVLNRAAKLCIWGYQDWEFFTMSQQYAVMSIETSFTTMYVQSLQRPIVLELAPRERAHRANGIRTIEVQDMETYAGFRQQEYRVERESRGIPYRVVNVNGAPLRELRHRDSKRSILDFFRQQEIIAPGEMLDFDYLLWERNYFSHPHGTHVDMMGEATSLLAEVVTLINRTWMRFLHPEKVIWEHAWEEAPRWANRDTSLSN